MPFCPTWRVKISKWYKSPFLNTLLQLCSWRPLLRGGVFHSPLLHPFLLCGMCVLWNCVSTFLQHKNKKRRIVWSWVEETMEEDNSAQSWVCDLQRILPVRTAQWTTYFLTHKTKCTLCKSLFFYDYSHPNISCQRKKNNSIICTF